MYGFDMFPNTEHVEALLVLEREEKDEKHSSTRFRVPSLIPKSKEEVQENIRKRKEEKEKQKNEEKSDVNCNK